jgi:hypothetical protein
MNGAKANFVRRFVFLAVRYGVTNPLSSSHLQKITASEPSKSGYGQARLLSVSAGFGG